MNVKGEGRHSKSTGKHETRDKVKMHKDSKWMLAQLYPAVVGE